SAFRPSNGVWYIYQSAAISQLALKSVAFGIASDRLAPADYDGDFITDIAVFREGSSAYFYILQSRTNTFRAEQFGTTGDVPTVGDWDGDNKADISVYRNGSTAGAQSYFYYRPTAAAGVDFRQIAWGSAGDKPIVGDFDGDGKQDATVFRPSNGVWYISRTSDNQLQAVQFGISTDKLAAADYDGDNKTDIAVFRNGFWYLQRSQLGFAGVQFGLESDVPTPADYDGDGKADIGVFRNGTWYLNRSTAGFTGVPFGAADDKPIPNAFVP
ncbi:MAG: VCBS repeat-containing protein, partial [Acidobacteriota bacterium]|nr:VCBS repeat-containing protein [Acidobacteriota bacterium]